MAAAVGPLLRQRTFADGPDSAHPRARVVREQAVCAFEEGGGRIAGEFDCHHAASIVLVLSVRVVVCTHTVSPAAATPPPSRGTRRGPVKAALARTSHVE